MNWIAVLFARWGFWWFCLSLLVAAWADSQDSGSGDDAFVAAIAIGIGGGLLLGQVQSRLSSRPCPRCGERVPNGQLDCTACGFDFDAI